ncbi:MAG: hypothetical protein K5898_06690 [Ruminococcus sp.]|uniref:serpin family protein n=1 Tax=Ruminococcus sp. TaxID=41978 RepID=UPI0025E7C657|nr:serpin family protein [Ruminococcus sp.]MCR4794842.1 hypothetical protein [Ruminococcus sp.]
MKRSRLTAAVLALSMAIPAFASTSAFAQDTAGSGDVNNDTVFNISDIVMMQRWLGGKVELKAPENADVNGDGTIDVFDMCQMRRMLIGENETEIMPVSRNLCSGIAKSKIEGMEADDKFAKGQRQFAVNLFKAAVDSAYCSEGDEEAEDKSDAETGEKEDVKKDDKNVFISPYSVMQSLAMTANGAKNETLGQMEEVLGGVPIEELNKYMYLFRNKVGASDQSVIDTANSVWVKDDPMLVRPVPEFIQKNLDYYDAEYYLSAFDDNTLKDINKWVDTNTRHYIPEIVDEIKPDDIFVIIDAVVLDAEWQSTYMRYQVCDWIFEGVNDEKQGCEFMSAPAEYIGDDDTDGFIKRYKDKNIAYAALLPHEDIDIHDYIKDLTPEKLDALLAQETNETTATFMPKYCLEYANDLTDELKAMGMDIAFDESADFTGLSSADVPTYLRYVKHKTTLDVNEKGTRATAATASGGLAGGGVLKREVLLTRPYVYCIYDIETRIPLFMGTLMNIPEKSSFEPDAELLEKYNEYVNAETENDS